MNNQPTLPPEPLKATHVSFVYSLVKLIPLIVRDNEIIFLSDKMRKFRLKIADISSAITKHKAIIA